MTELRVDAKVDGLGMDTVIRPASEFEPELTFAGALVQEVVARLAGDRDIWPGLSERVTAIRDGLIREQVTPLIEAALSGPLRTTNAFGEPTGKTTTLREIIMAEAGRQLTMPQSYPGERRTVVEKLIADEVGKAFKREITEQVAEAGRQVNIEIGKVLADALSGIRARR